MTSVKPGGVADAHTEMPDLSGRTAVITGGTTGIGRAIAVLLASYGVSVFICGRDANHLADALARIREVGHGDGVQVDLAEAAGLERFFNAAEDRLGHIDIAIINAAEPAGPAAKTNEVDTRRQLELDFVAYIVSAQHAATRMRAGGDIVFIGSMSAVAPEGGGSLYVAAKSGVQGFAAALRQELAPRDIKVGHIAPGYTGSDFHGEKTPPEAQRKLIHEDRMLRAEDVAVAVHYMLTQPRRAAVSLIHVEPRLPDS